MTMNDPESTDSSSSESEYDTSCSDYNTTSEMGFDTSSQIGSQQQPFEPDLFKNPGIVSDSSRKLLIVIHKK